MWRHPSQVSQEKEETQEEEEDRQNRQEATSVPVYVSPTTGTYETFD